MTPVDSAKPATDPASTPMFSLHYDGWGRLVLTDASGLMHVGVETVRSFPLSDPNRGIAVCDSSGRELAWVEDPALLPDNVRLCLEDDLARREFVPLVLRIVSVSASTEPSEWDVETDRGRTRFRLKSEDDVRRLSGDRAMITDANGVRYLIPNLRGFNSAAARILERYL